MTVGEVKEAEQRVLRGSGKVSIFGTAFFAVGEVRKARLDTGEALDVEPEESAYRWHAEIVGWPSGSDPMSKARRTRLTQELLRNADPVVVR